jgi:hypothetical protein
VLDRHEIRVVLKAGCHQHPLIGWTWRCMSGEPADRRRRSPAITSR